MIKSTLYIASSVNGFITRGDSDSGWVSSEDEIMFADTCVQAGCILVGRKTFEQYQGSVYPVRNAVNIVLSRQESFTDSPSVHYVRDIESALTLIKNLGFDRFITVGGAEVADQCLDRRIIDRIYLSLHPYIFSNGLRISNHKKIEARLIFEGIKMQHKDFLLLDYSVDGYA